MLSWARRVFDVLTLRRFEAAKTNRLNSDHWKHADGATINDTLQLDLPTLRNRTINECQNNSFLAGVVETHKTDVVGASGPALQVQSDNEAYNRAMEEVWAEWWEQPELTGQMSGVDCLQQDVGMLWMCGEFIDQIVTDAESSPRAVQQRIHPVHPRRLDNPADRFDASISLGVRRDRYGRPLAYYIADFASDQAIGFTQTEVREIPADQIIHGFRRFEPGQIRGFPLAAPALQVIADVRDFDAATLRAARIAAEFGVLLESTHADIEPIVVNETVDWEGGVIRTCPPGWRPTQITPQHPGVTYKDFRHERLREIGRPVNMPLMMVLLDSNGHNYSSARFDGQLYNRGVQCLQSWFTRIKLSRLFTAIEPEMRLLRGVRRPEKVSTSWTWPVAPHVDPQKEAEAIGILLDLGLISEIEASAMLGRDYENTQQLKKRAAEIRSALGIDEPSADATDAAKVKRKDERAIRRVVEEILGSRVNSNQFTVTQ